MSQYLNQAFNISSVFFLIIGTTIGASMLTLPVLCQKCDLTSFFTLFIISLSIMQICANYYIELTLEEKGMANIPSFLSKYATYLTYPTQATYLIFLWSLLASYSTFVEQSIAISPLISIKSLVIPLTLCCYLLMPMYISAWINKIAVIIMISGLIGIFSTGIDTINFNVFKSNGSFQWEAFPLFLMSFGYHLTIPSLKKFLTNESQLKKTAFAATISILVIYFVWVFIVLGTAAKYSIVLDNSMNFFHEIASLHQSDQLLYWVSVFSNFAVLTSFFGVSLGVRDYLQDWINDLSTTGKVKAILMTIIPPTIIRYCFGSQFITILNLAAYFSSYLLIVLPCWLIYKKRGCKDKIPLLVGLCGVFLMFNSVI